MKDIEFVEAMAGDATTPIRVWRRPNEGDDIIYIGENMSITPIVDDETVPTLAGPRTWKRQLWLVEQADYIPGCHYMPNGDPGYPDETVLVEVGQYHSLLEAAKFAILREIEISLEGLMDHWSEQEYIDEKTREE